VSIFTDTSFSDTISDAAHSLSQQLLPNLKPAFNVTVLTSQDSKSGFQESENLHIVETPIHDVALRGMEYTDLFPKVEEGIR
jgi:hypothetical protein